ncbi:hypothetical protein GXW78_20535 [Roseomonas terrae]|uniref:CBS domain-containing protein n=1 Tax=Neoroseomonas terrae TaxID=424799 RepID=A0ABS5EM01_9PROT|nr:hypothetical protein [Neoroseomonas terrae]MBR0652060.1 hypothetical protein [Neoroseomonas terrae]
MSAAESVSDLRRQVENAVARHALAVVVARDPEAGTVLVDDNDRRRPIIAVMEGRVEATLGITTVQRRCATGRAGREGAEG